ncbi:hypothetical protein [Massilia sp. BSC265]|uniref:hypothetical protein n=1 Tax=Massilia sp. BSC265 TaxID=1549812 RepID=UPI0004E92D66|nr:hypothetical protein [Massilia sp. BSC265]KFI06197.1 hypothetical protein JN27_19070 [Massilia sp. BSC265]
MNEASAEHGLADKLIGPVSSIIDRKRGELMPMLAGGAGQAAQHALRDDECVRKVATFCYPLLPGLVRLAVKEPVFVSFVLNNREKVLGRLASPTGGGA